MGLVTFGDIFYILYFLETYLNHDRYLPSHTLNLTTTTDPEVNQLGKLSSVNFSLRRVPEGSLSQTHTLRSQAGNFKHENNRPGCTA